MLSSITLVGRLADARPADDGPKKADVETLHRIQSARTIACLMTIGRDLLTKAETVTDAIEAGVPTLVEPREIIAQFLGMIGRNAAAGLSSWIERARASLVAGAPSVTLTKS